MRIKGTERRRQILEMAEKLFGQKGYKQTSLEEIAEALKSVLEQTPPELAGDIVENGIVLTGGGALIRGLDKYLSDIVKLPVYIAEDPLLAVAKGTGKALDEIDILQQMAYED